MTIALGILGQQCLVIGADTEESYGSQKYQQGKIISFWRGGPNPLGAICISGAGSAAHIDASAQEIVRYFEHFTGTMDEFETWLKDFVRTFWVRHIKPFVGRVSDVPEFELVIGARHEHTTRLWTTQQTVINRNNPYVVVGISRGASQALLGQLYQPFPSLNVAALLATYVIRQAKLSAIGVGLDTEIRFIYLEGSSLVPDERIKAWEEIFSRYQHLQREMFSYVSGFSELVVRLPGVVVNKKRELRDVIRDLKKMRKELSKLPVIQGVDDPSKRTISKESELGATMTNETKSFIEPEDILGVEFECGHCHSRFLYKLPDAPMRIIYQCPNCNEPFYHFDRQETFKQFFALLTAMPRLTEGSKLKIRLEITPSASRTLGLEQ
jgi:hypothetical protein